jgi:hypothetical protein
MNIEQTMQSLIKCTQDAVILEIVPTLTMKATKSGIIAALLDPMLITGFSGHVAKCMIEETWGESDLVTGAATMVKYTIKYGGFALIAPLINPMTKIDLALKISEGFVNGVLYNKCKEANLTLESSVLLSEGVSAMAGPSKEKTLLSIFLNGTQAAPYIISAVLLKEAVSNLFSNDTNSDVVEVVGQDNNQTTVDEL